MLLCDARRPWSGIVEITSLSLPLPLNQTVSGLYELGVIQRFTLDIDRSQFASESVLLTFTVKLDRFDVDRETLLDAEVVEYVFTTAENDLLSYARIVDEMPCRIPILSWWESSFR